MTKQQILKKHGMTEKEFYKKYPTPDHYAAAHPKEAQKMGLGGSIGASLGGAAGTALLGPGIGTAIGGTLGQAGGALIDSIIAKSHNNKLIQPNLAVSPVTNPNPYGEQYGIGGKVRSYLGNTIDYIIHGNPKKWKYGVDNEGNSPKNSELLGNFSYSYPEERGFKDGGSIHIKPKNKGKFTEYKKRTGKTTEEALHSSNPHVRQMANFARNAKKWKHEDGGIAGEGTAMQQPQSNVIDIEKGEARVGQDQYGRSVIKEKYFNPNKFARHADNPNHEPIGNFVEAPEGDIIISRPQINTYQQGDDITRKSIERKLVMKQMQDKPEQLGLQRSKKGGMVVKSYAQGGVNPLEDFYNPQGDYFNNQIPAAQQSNPFSDDMLMNYSTPEPQAKFGLPNVNPNTNYNYPGTTTNIQSSYNNPAATGIQSQSRIASPDTSGGNSAIDNIYGNVGRIAPIAADAIQFGRALFHDKPNRLHNAGYGQALDQLNGLETNVNIEPQLQQINRSRTTQINSINNSSNPAVNNARINQVQANALTAQNDVMGQKINTETGLRNSKREAIANLRYQGGSQDAAFQGQYDQEAAQNKAQAQNIQNAAISDAASKLSQYSSEDKFRQVIKEGMGDYFNFNSKSPWSGEKLFNIDPDKTKSIITSFVSSNPDFDPTTVFSPEVLKKYGWNATTKTFDN